MKVRRLVELLKDLPPELCVHIATPNPKYPDDIGCDNLWDLLDNGDGLKHGSEGLILIAGVSALHRPNNG